MGIMHVDKIVDMRRHLTLMESSFPETATTTFRNMETAGNPWGFPQSDRAAWADGLDVPLMADKGQADILFWVGCSGSYDDRNRKVAVAVAKIMLAAGVDFAILGPEERCTCESARRLGNEYLYQSATAEIVETLSRYRFQRILVICPHCMNTLSNEHPDFGGHYTVVHHTEFIQELLATGRLSLQSTAPSHTPPTKTVFHDSCYLGRINGIFDAPRQLLDVSGTARLSVPREREKGLCCGAGGGRMWLEENLGQPINTLRVRELLDTNPDQIAASCPFCITMLSDAAKRESNDTVPVLDIAELVAQQLEV
jgi:Fe-S oxidoreductase